MTDLKLPEDLRPENTVLFLGSGFSRGAIAINENVLPLGSELDNRLSEALDLPKGKYSGKMLAQYATKKPKDFLRKFLVENLTVKFIKPFHQYLSTRNWFRVYTTNFDDILEFARKDTKLPKNPLTFRDPTPNKFEQNSLVHLHGYIGRVTEGNASTELIYALSAYASLHSNKPEWFADFDRTIRFARHVIFVGYSVEYDEHVRDILASVSSLKDKTIFVLGGTPDPVAEEILADYGQVSWAGAEGLAAAVEALPAAPVSIVDPNRLRSFDRFDPAKDRKAFSPVTFQEVRNLIAFGVYNRNRFYRDIGDQRYLIYRKEAIVTARGFLNAGTSVLLHSHLGNGKTLFAETLAATLVSEGFECFFFKGETALMMEEMKFISSIKKAVLIIDDYTLAREVAPALRQIAANIPFVLTIRTGTFDYRATEVGRVFGASLGIIDLNRIEREEFDKFEDWARAAGIVANSHRPSYGRLLHIREFILDKFENSKVLRDKVDELVKSIFEDRRAFRALIVLMIFRHIGENTRSDIVIYKVLGYDPQLILRDYADIWGELSDQNQDFGSSVFSEFVISNFVDPLEVLRVLEEIVASVAVSGEASRRDDAIFAKCLNFGQMHRLCGADDAATEAIIAAYDRLRHNRAVSSHPLFWLQVAIAMTAKDDFRQAWGYIKTAYSHVTKEFEPYHIDTKCAEVLFRLGSDPREELGDEEIAGLDGALASCASMISNDRNRTDVMRALSFSEEFMKVRGEMLEKGVKVRFAYHLSKVVQILSALSPEVRARQATDELRGVVERSIVSLSHP